MTTQKKQKIDSIDYFYRLKPRKKKWVKENLEPDFGIEYFIYSFRTGKFYKRIFHLFTNIEKLEEHIKRQILCR